MDHINSFFSKLVKSIGSSDEKYGIIISILKESIGFEIDKKNIRIYGDTIYIRENPILKNEIFFKKKEILSQIAERIGNGAPINIK